MEIPMVAITGGPCSGKTTSMAFLAEKLSDFGRKVFIVPEAATIFIKSGFDPRVYCDEDQILRIQEAIFNIQLNLEEQWVDTAQKLANDYNCKNPVLLCDRGIMDVKDYLPKGFEGIFGTMATWKATSVSNLLNKYKGVIHLVTAANGAEKFYTQDNNEARRENPEEARVSDKAVQNCWLGHPHLRIIDNSTGFEQKIKRTLAAICRFLDIPTPIEIERKFLVSEVDTKQLFKRSQKIEIKQFYLRSERDEEVRLRERTYCGSSSYFLTTKKKTDNPAVRQEVERIISLRDALFLEKNRDYSKYPIAKERHCFLHQNQYFELDFFNHPTNLKNLIVLEIELTEENDKIEIPDWIKIKREVTGDPTYSNFNLAGPYNASTKFD